MSNPNPLDSTLGGYTCAACSVWVRPGTVHVCPVQFPPQPYMPAQFPAQPCNAHIFALHPDQLRLIIREELERAGLVKRPSDSISPTQEPK